MRASIEDIVKRSGEKIRTAQGFTIEDKGTRENIVTSMDVENEEFLRRELSLLIPGSIFVGEEGSNRTLPSEGYAWIVDPIDGTTNFSRGIPEIGISVALMKDGEPCIGVVYNPFTDVMYSAEVGKGATRNGIPIHVSDRDMSDSLLCTAWCAYDKTLAPPSFRVSERMHPICNDIRRIGTAAGELCLLAEGAADLYFEIRLMPWDHAAALICVSEAGGVYCGLHGNDVFYRQAGPVLAANNPVNLAILRGVVEDEFPDPDSGILRLDVHEESS